VTSQPMVHEMEVAHAAGRRMMGPHARMGGRWWSWYASGAEHWYDVDRDLVFGLLTFDDARYVSNVDAFEVCPSSNDPGLLPSWYAAGTVRLRGFYFAQTKSTLRCLELSQHGAAPLVDTPHGVGGCTVSRRRNRRLRKPLSAVCGRGGEDWHQPGRRVLGEHGHGARSGGRKEDGDGAGSAREADARRRDRPLLPRGLAHPRNAAAEDWRF